MDNSDPKKLLTIEDETRMRRSISMYFEDAGYTVLEASDGESGLDIFRKEHPDVVLLDLRMPGVSGLEVTNIITDEAPNTPVILVSGAGGIHDAIQGIRNGAWDYVTKPVRDMEVLEHVITQALEKAKLVEENQQYQAHLKELVSQRTDELRQKNKNLKELNARLRSLVRTVHNLHACGDRDEYCRVLLEEFGKHTGATGGTLYLCEASGLRLVHSLDPGHAPNWISNQPHEETVFGQAMKNKEPLFIRNVEAEGLNSSPWNSYPDGSALAFPLIDDSDNSIGVVGLHRRVEPPFTEQDLEMGSILASYSSEVLHATFANEALEKSRERLNIALEGAELGTWEWDIKNDTIQLNEWMRDLLAPEIEQFSMTEKTWMSYLHEEDRPDVEKNINEHLQGQTSCLETEYRVKRPERAEKWIYTRGRVLARDEDEQPLHMAGTCLDITARKMAEIAHQQLEEQMRHTQKLESLGVLAGGIAHDFNNLLMGIIGNVDLALNEVPPSSNVRSYLETVEHTSHQATELCQQMLAYSGRGRFVIEPLNVNTILTKMRNMLSVSVSKNVSLTMELPEEISYIKADASQVRQVVMNLVTNASEAIGEEGDGVITITTGTHFCDEDVLQRMFFGENCEEGWYVFLQVADNGCGMDEETKEKLFEPFFTTKFTGRGLGMSAVLGIIKGHQGTLTLESEPGQGTTFQIFLPVTEEKPEQQAPPSEEEETSATEEAREEQTKTALLVDDEEHVRIIGKRMLAKAGFEALVVESGEGAIEIVNEKHDHISCVILDLTMPQMDGKQILHEMRHIAPDMPVLISSGYDEKEIEERFDDEQPDAFIQKPYKSALLREKIAEAMQEKGK